MDGKSRLILVNAAKALASIVRSAEPRQFWWETTMGFIHQIIADLERDRVAYSQREDFASNPNAISEEIEKFAPRKMRVRQQPSDVCRDDLVQDLKLWKDRAIRAETRLRSIENSIQQIALKYANRFAARKHDFDQP